MLLTCGGTVRQLTKAQPGEGGSELPRWGRRGITEAAFRRLTTSPTAAAGGFDTNPDVSPDGRTVAFIRVLDDTRGIARSAVFTIALMGKDCTSSPRIRGMRPIRAGRQTASGWPSAATPTTSRRR